MAKPVHDWNYMPVQGYDITNAFGLAQGGINNAVAGIEKWMDVKSEIATGKALNALAQAKDAQDVTSLLEQLQEDTWIDHKELGDKASKRNDRFFDENITEQELAERLTAGAHQRKMAEGNLSLGWASHALNKQNSAVNNSINLGRYNMDVDKYNDELNERERYRSGDYTVDEVLALGKAMLSNEKIQGEIDYKKAMTDDLFLQRLLKETGNGKGKEKEVKPLNLTQAPNGYKAQKMIDNIATAKIVGGDNPETTAKVNQGYNSLQALLPTAEAEAIENEVIATANKSAKEIEEKVVTARNNLIKWGETHKAGSFAGSEKQIANANKTMPIVLELNLSEEGASKLWSATKEYYSKESGAKGYEIIKYLEEAASRMGNGEEFWKRAIDSGLVIEGKITDNLFFSNDTGLVPRNKESLSKLFDLFNEYTPYGALANKKPINSRKIKNGNTGKGKKK